MANRPLECTIFFSNVPYGTSAGYLRKVFTTVGDVEYIELYTDGRGRSIGAGVACFDAAESAARAVSEMDGLTVDGRQMMVKQNERESRGKGSGKGSPEERVFFNGVPYTTTEGFLRGKFEKFGDIVDFNFWRRLDGSSQGMGTCTYSASSEAEDAAASLNGTEVDGRQILVQMDDKPEASEGEKGKSKGKGKGEGKGKGKGKDKGKSKGSSKGYGQRVFWSGVPAETTEGFLRAQFERVGTIWDFDFWRKEDGTSLGKGTCEFDHYLGAWRALEKLHASDIDGGTLLLKEDDGGSKGKSKGKGKGKWY